MPNNIEYAIPCNVEVMGVDHNLRQATFIATTQYGADTWQGKTYLQMSGVDLSRFNANPIVLADHDSNTRSVLGRAAMRVESDRLLATVTFAKTRKSDEVWGLVSDGFLKGMSVGFIPVEQHRIDQGKREGDIEGPGVVVTKWNLLEVSIVPVGADPQALLMSMYGGNTPLPQPKEDSNMDPEKTALTAGQVAPPELAQLLDERFAAFGELIKEMKEELMFVKTNGVETAAKVAQLAALPASLGTPEPAMHKQETSTEKLAMKNISIEDLGRALTGAY